MGRVSLTASVILIGLLWKIAPGKTLSEMLRWTGAEGVVAGRAESAAGFHNSPLPAARCGSCHPQHYDQWRRSFHARSLTSDDFVRTFSQYLESIGEQAREDPQSSMACLSCHAPLLKHAGPETVGQIAGFCAGPGNRKISRLRSRLCRLSRHCKRRLFRTDRKAARESLPRFKIFAILQRSVLLRRLPRVDFI